MKLLLLLLVFIVASRTVLQNSFCSPAQNVIVPYQNNPNPLVSYFLTDICLTFENSTAFALSLSGYAVKQAAVYAAGTAICRGTYLWANPQLVVFAYPPILPFPASTCAEPSSAYPLCPWSCESFGGPYLPFFNNITAPSILTIAPDPNYPAQNWGGLYVEVPLICNDTTCGTADDLVPNLQANVSYTVRRLLSLRNSSCSTARGRALGAASGVDSFFRFCCDQHNATLCLSEWEICSRSKGCVKEGAATNKPPPLS